MIELGIVDLDGNIRTRSGEVKESGFDSSSVGLAPIEDSDLMAKLDGRKWSYKLKEELIEFHFCNVYKRDKPHPLDVRRLLRDYLKKYPYEVKIGPEIEFYIEEGQHESNENYMLPYPLDRDKPLIQEFMGKLDDMGYGVKLEHSEVGEGQHEITIAADDPMAMADKILFYKYYARIFFKENKKTVTFEPKPYKGLNGSGMHLHISLKKDGKQISFLRDAEGQSFLAGVLKHIKEITVFLNPTENSYDRLDPGYEAPVYISWGIGNRSALIRIPNYREGDEYRFELRSPDPLMNPYLGFIAILEAGLDGVRKKLKPPEPIQKNVYEVKGLDRLPSSLKEAIEEAEKSDLLKGVMGKAFDAYIKLKEKQL